MKKNKGKVKAHKETTEGFGVLITRRSDGERFFAFGTPSHGRFLSHSFGEAAAYAKELRKHISSPLRVARMRMTCELITPITPKKASSK